MSCTQARVIVGVTGSLANLQALRQGAAMARSRGAVLHAVHIWETGDDHETLLATAHKPGVVPRVRRVQLAFDEAMGGRPHDLDVCVIVLEGRPGDRLARLPGPDDLLVVGASIRPWWRPQVTRSVAARCVRLARCPVLVVPPAEMAREAMAREAMARRGVHGQSLPANRSSAT